MVCINNDKNKFRRRVQNAIWFVVGVCKIHVWRFICLEPGHQEKFEAWLSEINSSDGICLLTAFAHMAQPKRTDADPDFVRTVVLEIYKVISVAFKSASVVISQHAGFQSC